MNLLPDFEYRRPKSLSGVLSALEESQGKAVLLAGGTDLIPRMKLGLEQPGWIIDIKDVENLRFITIEGENLTIGTLTSVHTVAKNTLIKTYFPTLHEAAVATASEIIQIRGTIGGNLLQETRCNRYNKSETWRHAFPPCLKTGGKACNVIKGARTCRSVYCGDLAPALLSLDASVVVATTQGEREIPLNEIFTGNGTSPFSLNKTDLVKMLKIPLRKTRGRYKKFRLRETIDYPILGIALSVDDAGRGYLVLGACGPRPLRYGFSTPEEAADIPRKAFEDMKPIDNMPLPPRYRKHLVRVFAERVLGEIIF